MYHPRPCRAGVSGLVLWAGRGVGLSGVCMWQGQGVACPGFVLCAGYYVWRKAIRVAGVPWYVAGVGVACVGLSQSVRGVGGVEEAIGCWGAVVRRELGTMVFKPWVRRDPGHHGRAVGSSSTPQL